MIRFFFTNPIGTFIKDLICVAILMYIAYCMGVQHAWAAVEASI